MRSLVLFACLAAAVAALAGAAAAQQPDVGTLEVDRGRGSVALDLRGVLLGRLANGSITVTDRTPNDDYVAQVRGRRIVVQRRLGPFKTYYRGQGLRFSMLGGSYRVAVRGAGIAISAVGRGNAVLDGEPRFAFDDLGVYSLEEGVDCGVEPASCTPIPDEPVRLKLPQEEPPPPSPR